MNYTDKINNKFSKLKAIWVDNLILRALTKEYCYQGPSHLT